jgi:hypothetical protein
MAEFYHLAAITVAAAVLHERLTARPQLARGHEDEIHPDLYPHCATDGLRGQSLASMLRPMASLKMG